MAGDGELSGMIAAAPLAAGEEVERRRLRCFLDGFSLGDTLEDLQQLTEDLLEDVSAAQDGLKIHPSGLHSELKSTWSDARDLVASQSTIECGFSDPYVTQLVRHIDGRLKDPIGIEEIRDIRASLDMITARMARLVVKA